MSDFSALSTATSGLFAHRARIDAIGENLANVDTPGYHRQLTTLTAIDTRYPGVFSGPDGQHGGVSASRGRSWDQILEVTTNQQRSVAAGLAAEAGGLQALEAELNSIGSGDGLGDRLQALWNSFDELANDPADPAIRQLVLGSADAVVAGLRDHASVIDRLRANEVSELELQVGRVNELVDAIAAADTTIAAGVSAGTPPNGLLDTRDSMIAELSSLVSVQVSYDGDGQSRISLNGQSLVADGQSRNLAMTQTADASLAALGYNRVELSVGGSGAPIEPAGGAIAGGLTVANDLLPAEHGGLDTIAAALVSTVNALHSSGEGLDGSTGSNLFDPAGVTASTVAISSDVAGQPDKLAASDGTGLLDNSIARALAELGQDPAGASVAHAEWVGDLGVRVSALSGRAEVSQLALAGAENRLISATGVNQDEELADLVSAQRAYQASSRMVSAVDEMLDVLINRTGLVGR